MGLSIAQKIIKEHLVSGEMIQGTEIGLRIDQTLTQDATGTMAYLELEAMNIDRVKTQLSVAYIDHNTLQAGFENADDHRYIQSVAEKYGVVSRVRATESAIRFISNASAFRERRLSVQTATRRLQAVWACLLLERADSMLP
jgi:Aconitase A